MVSHSPLSRVSVPKKTKATEPSELKFVFIINTNLFGTDDVDNMIIQGIKLIILVFDHLINVYFWFCLYCIELIE